MTHGSHVYQQSCAARTSPLCLLSTAVSPTLLGDSIVCQRGQCTLLPSFLYLSLHFLHLSIPEPGLGTCHHPVLNFSWTLQPHYHLHFTGTVLTLLLHLYLLWLIGFSSILPLLFFRSLPFITSPLHTHTLPTPVLLSARCDHFSLSCNSQSPVPVPFFIAIIPNLQLLRVLESWALLGVGGKLEIHVHLLCCDCLLFNSNWALGSVVIF